MVVGLRSACNIYLAIVGSAIDGVGLKPIPFNYESNCSGIGASRPILVALCGQSTGQLALLRYKLLRYKLNGVGINSEAVHMLARRADRVVKLIENDAVQLRQRKYDARPSSD